jgi:hypothetical protein
MKQDYDYESELDFAKYIPVDISEDNTDYKISVRNIQELQPTPQTRRDFQIYNFQEFLMLNQVWDKPLMQNTVWYHHIYRGLLHTDLVQLCSDGGLRNEVGSFGVILSINNIQMSKTIMRIHEEYGDLTSYRSEAFGLLGALSLYNKLQDFTMKIQGNRQPTTVTIYCDNEALVDIVNYQSWRKFTRKFYYSSDADVIKEIVIMMRYIRSFQEIIHIKHIKGHQDRGPNALTYPATLNVAADHAATEALQLPPAEKQLDLPTQKASLYINNQLVSSHHTRHLREAYLLIPFREHLNNINNWSEVIFDTVWWSPHGKAMNKFGTHQQLMLQKYLNNRLPTNKRENRYYKYISSGCSVCHELETQQHILQCTGCMLRNTARKQYLVDLRSYFEQTYVSPTTTHVILSSVSAYINGHAPPTLQFFGLENTTSLALAFVEQSNIGWDQWFKGKLSKKWKDVYEHDLHHGILQTNNHPRVIAAEVWATNIIYRTWEYVRNSWQIRNDSEHGNNTDPIATQKEKLIVKILWCKTKITYFPNNYLRTLTAETLRGQPLNNLKMTDSQFQMLIRTNPSGQTDEETE